jgi:hypothetical protein
MRLRNRTMESLVSVTAVANASQPFEERFGFAKAELVDRVVARAASSSMSYASLLFPRTAVGMARWLYTVACLGEFTAPLGYRRCDQDLIARVRHDDRGIAIVPMAGDSATGKPISLTRGREPSSKWPKGERTRLAVEANAQLELFAAGGVAMHESIEETALTTYFLLTHADGHNLYAEISRPRSFSEGYVSGWYDRHLLEPTPFGLAAPEVGFDDDEEGLGFDIAVDPR